MPQQRLAGGRRAHAALTARKQRDVDERFEIGETRLLTAEGAMNSRSAARAMVPSSHTAMNKRNVT